MPGINNLLPFLCSAGRAALFWSAQAALHTFSLQFCLTFKTNTKRLLNAFVFRPFLCLTLHVSDCSVK